MDNDKIEKILIPIDFSESSLNAFETAIEIAIKNKASITIIYVKDNSFDSTINNFTHKKSADRSGEILSALSDVAQNKTGKKAETVLMEGPITASIVNAANKYSCDLIVIGAHGASGYRESFIGSNTYHVIKYAACPVLLVPTKKKIREFRNLFLPVKPLHGALKRDNLIRWMTSNGKDISLQIQCISSTENEDDKQLLTYLVDELKEKLSEGTIRINTQFSIGQNIADIVLKTAEDVRADLILLTPSIDITNKQFFIGPYTQRILHFTKTPVLIVKRNN